MQIVKNTKIIPLYFSYCSYCPRFPLIVPNNEQTALTLHGAEEKSCSLWRGPVNLLNALKLLQQSGRLTQSDRVFPAWNCLCLQFGTHCPLQCSGYFSFSPHHSFKPLIKFVDRVSVKWILVLVASLFAQLCMNKEVEWVQCVSGPSLSVWSVPPSAPPSLQRAAGPQEWACPTHLPSFSSHSPVLFVALNSWQNGDISLAQHRSPRPRAVWRIRREHVRTLTPGARLHQTRLFALCQKAKAMLMALCIVSFVLQQRVRASVFRMTKCRKVIFTAVVKQNIELLSVCQWVMPSDRNYREEGRVFQVKKERKTKPCRSLPVCLNLTKTVWQLVSMFASNKS